MYYKIGDFANMVGLSTSTLRDYEKRGILVPHHRSPSGYRFYSDEQYQDFISGRIVIPDARCQER